MTNALTLATTHGGATPSPLIIVVAVAAIAYVLWSRTQGRPLKMRRMLILPAVLTVIGITELTGSGGARLDQKDIAFLVVSVALSAVLGAIRGTTIELYSNQGELWQRYKWTTVALWILLIVSKLLLMGIASAVGASAGAGASSLLFSLGVSLLAEAALLGPRALSSGVPIAPTHGQVRPPTSSAPVHPAAPLPFVPTAAASPREPRTPGHSYNQPGYNQPGYNQARYNQVEQPRLRHGHQRGSRHSGPAHRLIGSLLAAQAQRSSATDGPHDEGR